MIVALICEEEIRKLAGLAKLSLDEKEFSSLAHDLNDIVQFADSINEYGPCDCTFESVQGLEDIFRKDVVLPSLDREEILKNANDTEGGYFAVGTRN